MRTFRVQVEQRVTGWIDYDVEDNEEDAEEVGRWAAQAVMDGDLRPDWEYGHVDVLSSWPKGAPCGLRSERETVPWCKVHDDPMQKDNGKECYRGVAERAERR